MKVGWFDFDKEENTRVALAKMWDAASQFVKSELRKLGIKRSVRAQLKQHYSIVL